MSPTSTAPVASFGDIALGKMVTPKSKTDSGREAPYLRAAHVQPHGHIDLSVQEKKMWFSDHEIERLTLEQGDVVIVEGGAGYGRSAVVPGDFDGWGFQNSIVRVRPNSATACSRYLSYSLQMSLDQGLIELEASTATIPHFTAEKVSRFRVPAHSLPIQHAIADYLDRETAEIDAMAAELDELVERLKERRVSAHADILPKEIPASWTTRSLSTMYVREKITGLVDEPMVSVFRDYGVVFKDQFTNLNVTAEDRNIYQLVDDGWLVVNRMKAWQGSVGVSRIRGISSGHYLCFRPIHNEDHDFLNLLFRSPQYTHWYAKYSRGVRPGQAEIDNAYLISMPVSIPPLEDQHRIVAHLDQVTAEIDSMISDAQELKALLAERRSALITEVVTGRKEVPVA